MYTKKFFDELFYPNLNKSNKIIDSKNIQFLNPEINLNQSTSKNIPQFGDIALVSTNQNTINMLVDKSFESRIGYSKIINTNKKKEVLEYLQKDSKTKTIILTLESYDNIAKISNLLKDISKTKNIIILNLNHNKQELIKTLIEESNCIYTNSLNELFALQIGLKNEIKAHSFLTTINDREIELKINEFIKSKTSKNLLVNLSTGEEKINELIAKEIVKLSKKSKKNIYISLTGHKETSLAKLFLDLNNIPTFQTFEEGLKTIETIIQNKNKKEKKIQIPLNLKSKQLPLNLNTYNSKKKILNSLGLEYEKQIIEKEHDILNLKISPNQNYVIKTNNKTIKNITHLNYENYLSKLIKSNENISIEKQIKGIEISCELINDNELETFIKFGIGGKFEHIFNDETYKIIPLTKNQSKELIEESKIYILLKDRNIKKLENTLTKLSQIFNVYPKINNMKLNIIVNKEEVSMVNVDFE